MDKDQDPDPDTAIFVIDLQDASKKLIFNIIFSAYYFLKVHLYHFSKIKSQKESQNSRNQGFLLFLHDDRRIRIRSRIRIHTSDKWIRIRFRGAQKHVDPDPQHCIILLQCDAGPFIMHENSIYINSVYKFN